MLSLISTGLDAAGPAQEVLDEDVDITITMVTMVTAIIMISVIPQPRIQNLSEVCPL